MSQWWIEQAAEHTVLDGAPSFGLANAGWCDLMLCRNDLPVGVVEVEGTRPMEKLHTIGQYFSSSRPELAGIQMGILVTYAYHARGRGAAVAYPPAEDPLVMDRAAQLSRAHPGAVLVVLTLDKDVDAQRSSLRSTVKYYWGSLSKVSAIMFENGQESRRSVLPIAGLGHR